MGFLLRPVHVARRALRCLHTGATASSSVNPEEVAFFSKLSSEWWDERGEFAMLHRMNPARVGFVRDKIHETILEERSLNILVGGALSGLDVLDIGCGGGLLSEVCAFADQDHGTRIS
jgi:2-polyprenyl-6-hydroxyphenyl methylase/3-demethylubiquinone-9 3-methyltransferase